MHRVPPVLTDCKGINLLTGHSPEKLLLFHMEMTDRQNEESHHYLKQSGRQIIVVTVRSPAGIIVLMYGTFYHNLCINTGACALLHTYLCFDLPGALPPLGLFALLFCFVAKP